MQGLNISLEQFESNVKQAVPQLQAKNNDNKSFEDALSKAMKDDRQEQKIEKNDEQKLASYEKNSENQKNISTENSKKTESSDDKNEIKEIVKNDSEKSKEEIEEELLAKNCKSSSEKTLISDKTKIKNNKETKNKEFTDEKNIKNVPTASDDKNNKKEIKKSKKDDSAQLKVFEKKDEQTSDETKLDILKKVSKKDNKEEKTEDSSFTTALLVSQNIEEEIPEQNDVSEDFVQNVAVNVAGSVSEEIPSITVIDERTFVENDKELTLENAKVDADNATADFTFTLSQNSILPEETDVSLKNMSSTNFSAILSDKIESNAAEFVKAGSIILKDNNKGSINLILHPEELGDVKIKLELADKIVTGRIIVSSEEAYNAFKNNLSSLKDAFVAGGFDNAGFELSWSGNSDSSGNGQQKNDDRNPKAPMYANAMPDVGFESNDDAYYYDSNSSINVIA